MNIKEFQAGKYLKGEGYTYFLPNYIDHDWELTPELVSLTNQASRYLGELNAYSALIPNIELYITMHVAKEAETSSKIEGTKTNIEDVFTEEIEFDEEKRDDLSEVLNYIKATNFGIQELVKLPISTRLLKEVHKILLASVRGTYKQPGQVRTSQNWIGGSTILDAHFIPPHQSHLQELLSDLEKFIHNQNLLVPDLVKIGIVHYQFETIHPFLDGNGRIGRLLIVLYLVNKGILNKPVLYLSEYFEKFRNLYYQNLDFSRTQDNLEQWLKFFLVAVTETSKKGIQTFQKIMNLNKEMETLINDKMRNKLSNASQLLKFLYQKPVTTGNSVASELNISFSTAQRLVNEFTKYDILVENTGLQRNREYVFSKYLNLFRTDYS